VAARARLAKRTGDVCALWLFWLGPAFLAVHLVMQHVDLGIFAVDFRGTVRDGGLAVLHGGAPYPSPETLEPVPATLGSPFVYPPVILWLAVPFAALPAPVSEAVWAAALFAAVGAAMLAIGVRDWRCLGIAALSVPVLKGVVTGNVTLLLVLLVALAWRWRDHRWRGAAAVGAAVALKLFLWPLFVWLLATRRFRSAWLAGLIAVGSVVGSWALIGFQGLGDYPALLHVVDEAYAFKYISVSALSVALGASEPLAHALQYAVGSAIVVAGALIARQDDGERRSFSVMVIGTFVLTPIVWAQNLALLFVPVALLQPRLGRLWWAAWATFWFEALGLREAGVLGGGGPMLLRCVVILGFVGCVLFATARHPGRKRRASPAFRLVPS
jgi:hypothetical protein